MNVLAIPIESAPRVSGPPQGRWTYADWEKLDHSEFRYEIIEGVLYVTKSPKPIHQWTIKRLNQLLGDAAEEQNIATYYFAPIGVIMPGCDPVQPDFVMIRMDRLSIVRAQRIEGVPDLIAEVLSPGTADFDEGLKLEAYARCGVPEYVVIDPEARVLRAYRLEAPGKYGVPRPFSEGERRSFESAPGIVLAVADLFAGAPA